MFSILSLFVLSSFLNSVTKDCCCCCCYCGKEFAGTHFQASSTCTQERSGTDVHELPYGKWQAGN